MLTNDNLPEFLYIDSQGDICNRHSRFALKKDYFTVSTNNKLTFYDFRTTEVKLQIIVPKRVKIEAYHEFEYVNTRYCVIGLETGAVYVYHFIEGNFTILSKYKAHNKRITNIHHYKSHVITSSFDGSISNFDLHSESIFYYAGNKKAIYSTVLQNKKLYAHCTDSTIKVWDITSRATEGERGENDASKRFDNDTSKFVSDNDASKLGLDNDASNFVSDCFIFSEEILFFLAHKNFLVIFSKNGETSIFNTQTKISKKFNTFKNLADAKICKDKLFILLKEKLCVYKINLLNNKNKQELFERQSDESSENEAADIFCDAKLQSEFTEKVEKFWSFEISCEKIIFATKNKIELFRILQDKKKIEAKNEASMKNGASIKNEACIKNEVCMKNGASIKNELCNSETRNSEKPNKEAHDFESHSLEFYKSLEFHRTEICNVLIQKNNIFTISSDKIIFWSIFDDKIHKINSIAFDFEVFDSFLFNKKIFVSANEKIHVFDTKNGNLIVNKNLKVKKMKNLENRIYAINENKLKIYTINESSPESSGGVVDCQFEEIWEHNFDETTVQVGVSSIYYGVSLYNNNIVIFDRKTNDQRLVLYGHSLPVHNFTFSNDNKQILSCGLDKLVKLWGTDFGECRRSFVGHCKNAEFITDDSFVFVDNSVKYFYKNKLIKEYKGFDQRIVKYNRRHMVVATKFGIKVYKVGEYEMFIPDKSKGSIKASGSSRAVESREMISEFESSSETDDFLVKDTKIVNYKKFEHFTNELEKENVNSLEILNCIKNLDFGEVDNFVYLLSNLQIRNILNVIKTYMVEFPILMGRFLDVIIKIHPYLCEYNKDVFEIYNNIRNEIEENRNEMGCNYYYLR